MPQIPSNDPVLLEGSFPTPTNSAPVFTAPRRFKVESIFDRLPATAAEVDPASFSSQAVIRAYTQASREWLLSGTNAAAAGATFAPRGGVKLATAGSSGDQMILSPLVINSINQHALGGTQWTAQYQPRLDIVCTAPSTITSMRVVMGMKLTAGMTIATDDDQALFVYDTAAGSSPGLWHCVSSVGGVDIDSPALATTSRSTFRAGDRYVASLAWDNDNRVVFLIDNQIVGTSEPMTTGINYIPVLGVEASTGAAREMTFNALMLGQNQ